MWLKSRRRNVPWKGGLTVLVILIVSAFAQDMVFAAHTSIRTVIPLKDTGYTYKEVSWGAEASFQQPSYNDASFPTGNAGFGTTAPGCPWNNSNSVKTSWNPNTDILLRKHFTLQSGEHNLRVVGTVDNDADVYINGTLIGSARSGYCRAGDIDFTAPDGILVAGDNVLAIRGHDYGGATYIDVEVTVSISTATIMTVAIDIKPDSYPNSINLKSKGVIPVAILSGGVGSFDATTVDPSTVCFGAATNPSLLGDCTEAHGRGHIEDVDGDGDLDLLLHYETQQTGIGAADTVACLTGQTFSGNQIRGCDAIRIVG